MYDLIKDILIPVYGVLLVGIITIVIAPAFYKEWVLRIKRLKPIVYFFGDEFRLTVYRVSKYIESTKRVVNYFKYEQLPGSFCRLEFGNEGYKICFFVADGPKFRRCIKESLKTNQITPIDSNTLYREQENSMVIECATDIHVVPTSITTLSGSESLRYTLICRFEHGPEEIELLLSLADIKGLMRFLKNKSFRHRNRYFQMTEL